MSSELKRELGFWDLVLFHITAIVGLRWIAVAAGLGYASITLWLLAFVLFFLPQAYVLLHLSRKWPVEGGLYEWIKMALGPFHGYFSGWCYWVNNITYYPSLMAAAAGFATYIVAGTRGWEESRVYVVTFSIISFWIVVWLELVGMQVGKWVQNAGAVATWVAAVLPMILGVAYVAIHGSATPFSLTALLPNRTFDSLSTWSVLCFAMAGFELLSLMGGEIKDPGKNMPRSIIVGGAIATLIYILGTVSLIVSVSPEKISVISGILQALTEQSRVFSLWLLPNVVAVLLVIGQFGGAGAWLAGSGRMLLMVGVDQYMPKSFSKIHPRWGTPHVAILVQAVIASAIVILSALGSTVQQFYINLLKYNLIIYFIPYLYLFLAYGSFMRKKEMPVNIGGVLSVVFGFLSTLVAIVLSFIPPSDENAWGYEAKVCGVFLGMLLPGLIFYIRASHRRDSS